jgi:hypothetical protein
MLEKRGQRFLDLVSIEQYLGVAGVFRGDQINGFQGLKRTQCNIF